MRKFLLLLFAALMVTSCVTSPFKPEKEYYFQAMGDDSEIVMTVDAEKAKNNETLSISSNMITKRTDRVSVALDPSSTREEDYPLPIENYLVYGALEGNFPKGMTNMGLGMTDGFEKVRKDGEKFFLSGDMEIGIPKSGLVVFSSDDYLQTVDKTVNNREIRIPYELSHEMAAALASFYVKTPKTMLDLGFDLPLTVLLKMDNAVIFINEHGLEFTMSARIMMQDNRSAKTLTTVLRNNIVADLRRNHIKPDFKELEKLLYQEERMVIIDKKPISAEEAKAYFDKANNMFGGIF